MLRTIIKMLTPFIIAFVDVISGVIMFLRLRLDYNIDLSYRDLISHTTGSSILLMLYVIVNSTHMCKYYKSACYMILALHIYTIIYVYTDITTITYTYTVIVFSLLSLVCWTISVLGHKTYKTIHQACKH